MRVALLLVDLQADFLARPALVPAASELVANAAQLMNGCRRAGVPVLHIHSVYDPDGSDRMPHWQRQGIVACVEGTPGVEPPPELAPTGTDIVLRKRFFNAFGNPDLDPALRSRGIDTLIVAGVYLHGCVRSTALEAYERGYEIWIAEQAVGSTEADHAAATRRWLEERAARFLDTAAILANLARAAA